MTIPRLAPEARLYWAGYLSARCKTPALAARYLQALDACADEWGGACLTIAAKDDVTGAAHDLTIPPTDYRS